MADALDASTFATGGAQVTDDPLDARLRLWGNAFGEFKKVDPEPRSPTGNSPMAAYGRPTGYQGQAEKRNGKDRLKLMGAVAGFKGKLPAHFVDPVPCTGTRTYKAPDFDPRYTAEVDFIQKEWLIMYRVQPMLAAILRVEYQTKGPQVEKAEAMKLKHREYKDQLRMAKLWIRARFAS